MSDEDNQTNGFPLPNELLEKAKEIHEYIYDQIDSAGASIAVVGIIFTNMLMAARLSGAGEDFIEQILSTIQKDVEDGVAEINNQTKN